MIRALLARQWRTALGAAAGAIGGALYAHFVGCEGAEMLGRDDWEYLFYPQCVEQGIPFCQQCRATAEVLGLDRLRSIGQFLKKADQKNNISVR